MTGTLRLIVDSAPGTPAWNMAVDEALLIGDSPVTLRLYSWKPYGLSLGWFQPDMTVEEVARWEERGVDIVRRLTGGGAILHANEVTYSLSGPDGEGPFSGGVDASYRLIHDAMIELFLKKGIPAGYAADAPGALKRREQPFFCFTRATALDILADGRKLVGSAKRRSNGRALQHGSVILSAHPRGGEMAALDEWLQDDAMTITHDLAATLASAIGLRPIPSTLSDEERKSSDHLALEHYADPRRRR